MTDFAPTSRFPFWARRLALTAGACFLVVILILAVGSRWIVLQAIHQAGFSAKIESVSWRGPESVQVDGFFMGQNKQRFAQINRLRIEWSWWRLLRHHEIDLLDFDQPILWTGRLTQALASRPAAKPSSNPAQPNDWKILTLRVSQGSVLLDNLGYGLQVIPIYFGKNTPTELHNLTFDPTKPPDSNEQVQTQDIEDIAITSPYDVISPVLTLPSIHIAFTWSGLLRNQLKEVTITDPVLYVGPDLFWFSDQLKQHPAGSSDSTSSPWSIQSFAVDNFRLSLSNEGQPALNLPFPFYIRTQNLRLDQIKNAPFAINMPPTDYDLPAYGIKIRGLQGKLELSLSPNSNPAENLVPTFTFQEISWRNIGLFSSQKTEAFISATFDKNGIYGKTGGYTDGGYATGGFLIPMGSDDPWRGWFGVDRVNTAPLIEKIGAPRISMNGQLGGKLDIKGRARDILDTTLDLQVVQPGKLEILAIDQILQNLPADWSQLKQQLSRSVLESFREYDFSSGSLQLHYQKPVSTGLLDLQGKQGGRRFEIQWEQRPAAAVANPPP